MKYLGVPISSVSLNTSDWDYVWMANSLKILTPGLEIMYPLEKRNVLIDASLSSILYYLMYMFLFNKTFLEKADKHRKRFLWQKKKGKKCYHMVKWSKVCRSKSKGGLGIKDLQKKKLVCLLSGDGSLIPRMAFGK
jgi:hypothetical protein